MLDSAELIITVRRMSSLRFATLWDELLSEGVVATTAQELAQRAHTSVDSVYVATHRARAANKLFSPAPGLYVLVPPEYRSWGAVPADWFIDDLMRHLGHDYYISLLSAAAMYGATHQAAQLFQVMTDRRTSDRDVGNLKLRFYVCRDLGQRPSQQLTGPTGRLTVATPETCALDLAERPKDAGGVTTLLEILGELPIDAHALDIAASNRPLAVARRCGWLLQRTDPDRDLTALRQRATRTRSNPTPLVPGGPARGQLDRTWNIVVNTMLEDTR